jgi:hypothetical protein
MAHPAGLYPQASYLALNTRKHRKHSNSLSSRLGTAVKYHCTFIVCESGTGR